MRALRFFFHFHTSQKHLTRWEDTVQTTKKQMSPQFQEEKKNNAHLIVIFDPSNEIIDVWCPQTEITALFHFSLKDCSTAISHVFFSKCTSDFCSISEFFFLQHKRLKCIYLKKGANWASVKILISLHQTLYANEVYELMHDPIRIITAPVGSEAGAISEVVP